MKPLIDKKFRLEKFPGKGGWTYALLPDFRNKDKKKKNPFNWKKVRGTIDDFEIRKYHLMPMGNGKLFLPVKKEIRKAIGKEDGDYVRVILFPDDEPEEVPEEFMICLQDEPLALKFFKTISESEQRYYIKWIYSAKREETKINRMAKSINRLARGLKLYTPEEKE